MPKEGQVWPLQLVCLLLVLGLLTFIDPTLFGQKAPISREASLLLLGGATLTGIVLYSPLLPNPAQLMTSIVERLDALKTQMPTLAGARLPQAPGGKQQ